MRLQKVQSKKYDIYYKSESPLVSDFLSFCKINKFKFTKGYNGCNIKADYLSYLHFSFFENYCTVQSYYPIRLSYSFCVQDFREALEKCYYHGITKKKTYKWKWKQ